MITKVLVVDDEEWVLDTVRRYLEQADFEVIPARDGVSALEAFARTSPDLVILDWMLPRLDGLSVAERIRMTSAVPIIMLTARVTERDRLAGFDAGVDDYVVKPFSTRELEARVRAVLRRSSGKESPIQEVSDLRLDREQRLVWVRGEPVELSAMGFDLLAFLITHPGRVFTRLELLEAVRGETYGGFERSIDSHIKRLRQRIEPDPAHPSYILTVFGVGYRFAKGEDT
ncbi:MAG: response regulator transcription factor [Candidatus Bipolaricaulota bacterium]|nr:response regulator transcription factor [Candidatus Bipolaricaulota bacterium]